MQDWGVCREALFRPLTLDSLEHSAPIPIGVLLVFSGPRDARKLIYVLAFRSGVRLALARAIQHPQVLQSKGVEWVAVSTGDPDRRAQRYRETVPGAVVESSG